MTEQQPYEVVRELEGFELRRYPRHLVAQVEVRGTFDGVGSAAFAALFGYITGQNESRDSIEMTAPVVLPATMTEQSAPKPTNPSVRVRVGGEAELCSVRRAGHAIATAPK